MDEIHEAEESMDSLRSKNRPRLEATESQRPTMAPEARPAPERRPYRKPVPEPRGQIKPSLLGSPPGPP